MKPFIRRYPPAHNPRMLLAVALLALAACASTTTLEQTQKRLVSGIQTAQQASTAALVAGSITVQQDRAAQARLAGARAAVLAAPTSESATSAASAVGVQP